LVLITPNSGAVVAHWNEADIIDIYRVRIQLEALAASLAAERRSEDQLMKLEASALAMKALVDTVPAKEADVEIARLNSEFHHLVIQAASSRALLVASAQVVEAPMMLRTFRRYDQERLRRSASDHLELVSAIRARDAELAGSIMRAHILAGLRALQQKV
jgi:DNA-binding GntR family transcriptional regulator